MVQIGDNTIRLSFNPSLAASQLSYTVGIYTTVTTLYSSTSDHFDAAILDGVIL